MANLHKRAFSLLEAQLSQQGINVKNVMTRLSALEIETPSWGYAQGGTRFGTFIQPGAASSIEEKLADAAMVNRLTGCAPSVALHIPWDKTDDWKRMRKLAAKMGLRLGAINPNLFQAQHYQYGSVCHPSARVRKKALNHLRECCQIMKDAGSDILSVWLADGTDYPGQDNMRQRKHYLEEALAAAYEMLPGRKSRILIEYKCFEPAFYHTDIPDWGMSYLLATKLGPRAQVLVDLGHHALGTNIEQIVALLIDEGRLGGFHFNDKKFADDDLTAGSINPYQLFLIFNELIDGWTDPKAKMDVAFMVDQCHIAKGKIEAMIQTIMNLQTAYAKALLIDRKTLRRAQRSCDTVLCEATIQKAYQMDVTPLLAEMRIRQGRHPCPLCAYRESGYQQRIEKERCAKNAGAGGAGYPT